MSKDVKTNGEKGKTTGHGHVHLKSVLGAPVSINDLREKEFNSEKLSKKEKLALVSFDKYRIKVLNQQENEGAFHKKYMELQILSNLTGFDEFLKEEYISL